MPLLNFIKKVLLLIHKILIQDRLDENEKTFIEHNKQVWGNFLQEQNEGDVLVESCSMASSIIAFSYLANILAKIYKARIVVYSAGNKRMWTVYLNRSLNKIYQSFNSTTFISYSFTTVQEGEVERLFSQHFPRLRSKKDVEDLTIDGAWIGDLLYDSHCMNYKVPTVLIGEPRFSTSLRAALRSYIFWRDYFESHRVRGVIVSHTVYIQSGIIVRLAIQRGIPVYQINATHLHYLTQKDLWAYNEFFYYPEQFSELPEKEQAEGLTTAKERLQKRLSGEVGVDMHYSSKSAYGKIRGERVLKQNDKLKILVATHCFFDAPHPYGINLFADFYEWLYFLGSISEMTDYDWYIKTHPDILPGNIPIIQEFIRRYPKFTLLPPETSHLQLKAEGIDFGLTVYGNIGVEYAALGIPVITASLCNPRIRYNFNIHPKTIDEYKHILLNLARQKFSIDMNEVYQYYFMAHVYGYNNWLFRDYDGFLREIGGYYQQHGSVSYEKFIKEFSLEKHNAIMATLMKFIESKEYNLRRQIIEKEVAV